MFKRETKTLKNLSYLQLRNLIKYFHRDSLSVDYNYTVTARQKNLLNEDIVFTITFPRSWIKELPMEEALKSIMNDSSE